MNIKEEEAKLEKENRKKKNINENMSKEKYTELKRQLMVEFEESLDRNIERYIDQSENKLESKK